MNNFAKSYLNYIRASLADAAHLMPDLSDDVVEITFDEIDHGKIGQSVTKQLFELAKKKTGRQQADEEHLWPIQLIVCPRVYALRPEHGQPNKQLPAKIAPVFVCARLWSDGSLGVDENNAVPIVPRDYLEPTRCDIAIGSVDDADDAYATLSDDRSTWTSLLRSAFELIKKVTGSEFDELAIEQYKKLPAGLAVVCPRNVATANIQRLIDLILSDDAHPRPLYENLISQAHDLPLKNWPELLKVSELHIGQMESRYDLSQSQRESLLHFLAEPSDAASILAVDGPPGTGKTTLLLSVIATLWVKHALEGIDAPLIIASSTNNQAIINILEAFAKVKEKPDVLKGRWLDGINSYGLFLPAKSREELGAETNFPVHMMKGMGREAIYDAQKFENIDGLDAARADFFQHFETAFNMTMPDKNLKKAAEYLRGKIGSTVSIIKEAVRSLKTLTRFIPLEQISDDSITYTLNDMEHKKGLANMQLATARERLRDARELRKKWKQHVSNEPWWIALMALVGIELMRERRDSAFCADAEIAHEALIGDSLRSLNNRDEIDASVDQLIRLCQYEERNAEESLKKLEMEFNEFVVAIEEFKRLNLGMKELTFESVQSALDVGPRFDAFKLATHYWEARYLSEVEERLQMAADIDDAKSPPKLERQYRRLAKLFPCFVSTLYTLPGRFIGWNQEDLPLFDVIDLLIVDEAGQVSPEIGVASFTLAKRALVVGDVDQIPPVWSIPHSIDGPNALRHKVVEDRLKIEEFLDSGLSASRGSLMRVAQRATPYSKHPTRGRGMFLNEHRRCWTEIIRICNELVYQGLLIPCREEATRKLTPSVGYVHIPGWDRKSGKSRENLIEAKAIAKWLVQRKPEIEDAFSNDNKSFNQLVAVITPFAAQTRCVKAALNSEFGPMHGITVGTIHALQGAERRVVIFSPTYGLDTVPETTFLNRDRSMLNVAISRAQDAFLIFGNMHLFQPKGSHPSAVVGRFLFQNGNNELKDVPIEFLVPGYDMSPGQLIRDLESHRAVLDEAFSTAKSRLIIVSPFIIKSAIAADQVIDKIKRATSKGIRVSVVSDQTLNKDANQFKECVQSLSKAGADVRLIQSQGVHSKMILVDNSWLVVGSFNWLSAVRDSASPFCRYESSIRYNGDESFQMISKTLRDLKELIGR